MVFDNLKNAEIYYGMHKNFKKAFDFIKKAVSENLSAERFEIDGENVYAFTAEYETNTEFNGEVEGHKEYIDLQYVLDGKERIDVVEASNAYTVKEYVKDVEFFKSDDDYTSLLLKKGDFAIFYPNDLHAPGLSYDGKSEKVKKMVVKIKL